MQARQIGLQCRSCGRLEEHNLNALACEQCGGPLRVLFDADDLKKVLSGPRLMADAWTLMEQWHAILPVKEQSLIARVSLGERETPLLPSNRCGAELGIQKLYFKIEEGPTLSLKDRGTALCVLKALEAGCSTVCVASSGNNAASVSAYGSRAGLRAVVFVQKQVSEAKIFKSLLHGGRVVRLDGDMAAASAVCNEMVRRHNWFQCGGPNPYRIAGKRTFAYGLVQQLGCAPDTVLIPCGGGAGMVAAYDAFRELLEAGVIDHMPRLVGVQLTACDPTAQAFHAGRDEVVPVKKSPSLSDAIMNNNPYWGRVCVEAARATKGTMISVTDEEFVQAIRRLGSREGLFAEPAGAVTTAALKKLLDVPGFADPGITVCNITGHGLNAPHIAADSRNIPPVTEASADAVEAFLASGE